MTIIARWRSAITGRFVTAAYAIRNAATTILQRMRRS
jgi:hypothetical protein